MAEQVPPALIKRRAELMGEVDALKARIAALVADARQIDAVIKQFQPDHDLGGIESKRRLRAADGAGRGEMARFVLGELRKAPAPLTAGDLARRLMVARGDGNAGGAVPRAMARRVAMALRHQELNGMVAATREAGCEVLWRLAG